MRIYLKLWPYLKPHLGLLGLSCICMLVSSLFKGVSLGICVPVIDVILLKRGITLPSWLPDRLISWIQSFQAMEQMAQLHLIAVVIVVLFILKNLFLFLQTYWMNDVALRFLRDIRDGLYRHYQQLSLDFFSGERTGELLSRITYDVSVLQNTITEGISDLVYQTAQMAVFTAMIIAIDWRLALMALVLLPAIGYPIVRIGKALRKLGFIVQQRMADLNSQLIETFQGIRVVKAFTAEDKESVRFSAINRDCYKANLKTVKRREALAVITDLISMAGGLLVLEVGGRAVLQGHLSPGTIVLFLFALISLYQPIKKLSRLHSVNQQTLTAAERVVDVLEKRPSVSDSASSKPVPVFHDEICFKDVWFRYEARYVLQGVDLTVRAGEVVAIVGASGSGKTTLVNLIPRFYDPTKGKVTLDGFDLREVTLRSLREQIGLVTQEPFLFHDTVRANISFGSPSAGVEKVVRAAKAANAHEFIEQLPKGYDTPVGELGSQLSGGQRQRIAIARALLKDPPLLILDEATSQLDSQSEVLVQEALERLMEGRTVFVISHRLSTIRKADRIIVLDQGRVAEVGRHEELLKGSSIYRRLYELQVAP